MNNPPTATRTDERIAMSHWLGVIEDTDIPTPETIPITVERDSEGRPTWDTDEIINAVTDLGGEAFVRTDFKSPRSPRAQHIHQPTEEQVELTFKELVFEVAAMMKLPIGDNYYLREWLDLTWDHYTDEDCHPEVRFFIRDGDVTCWHLRTDLSDDNPHDKTDITAFFNPENRDYQSLTKEVHEYAALAADALPDSTWYSVDFVLTTEYDWYLTDAAIDALYHNEEKGWMGVSAHPDDCTHALEHKLNAGDIDVDSLTKPQ